MATEMIPALTERRVANHTSTHLPRPRWRELGLVAQAPSMCDLFNKIERVAPTDVTVLIRGESGTGKELFAKALHALSPRHATGPFMGINCGAISENLLEAELFGSKRGAYTGSHQDRKGYFETCQEGTLFLDEIGEMPPSLQAKFLRVLQEREITPLGSSQTIKVNTRIVAATHCDILQDLKSGRFREDLFYRLSVVNIVIPPLRERTEDVEELVAYFVGLANEKFHKSVNLPTRDMLAQLRFYPWPGNVRELQNAVDRAVLMAESQELELAEMVPMSGDTLGCGFGEWGHLPLNFLQARDLFEKKYVEQLLGATKGNIAEAARLSGQYRPAIYRLLKKYHLDAGEFK